LFTFQEKIVYIEIEVNRWLIGSDIMEPNNVHTNAAIKGEEL